MATGTNTDLKIYPDQFFAGMRESLQENTNAFNGASNGSIQLVSDLSRGDFQDESFFKKLSGAVGHRDPNSTADATSIKLEQGEHTSIKIPRKYGPVENTATSFRRIAQDPATMSFIIGQNVGEDMAQDYLTAAITCVSTCLGSVTELTHVAGSAANHTALTGGLRKFGDKAQSLVALVMNSDSYFDMVDNAIADKLYEEAGTVVYGAQPGTFNRPTIVTDNASLTASATTNNILALTNGAVIINESETGDTLLERVGGKDNIIMRFQSEYAFNSGVKGFSWNKTAGVNPTNAALGTAANWVQVVSDIKSCAGVMITVTT